MIRPAPWKNQDIILFHGTDESSAERIEREPLTLHHALPGADFGPGFYMTTVQDQAESWARRRGGIRGRVGAVVELTIPRDPLALLDTLSFVLGDRRDGVDFWSFVWHCRQGALTHNRAMPGSSGKASYDLVCGPVASFWEQTMLIQGADQFSFHTAEALDVLNRFARKRMIRL